MQHIIVHRLATIHYCDKAKFTAFYSDKLLFLWFTVPVQNASIEGVANNSVLTLNSSQAPPTLTCRAFYAKPAPSITWYRNDVIVMTSSSGNAQSGSGNPTLRDTWSVVLTQPEAGGGDVTYKCRAGNGVGGVTSFVDVIVHLVVQSEFVWNY